MCAFLVLSPKERASPVCEHSPNLWGSPQSQRPAQVLSRLVCDVAVTLKRVPMALRCRAPRRSASERLCSRRRRGDPRVRGWACPERGCGSLLCYCSESKGRRRASGRSAPWTSHCLVSTPGGVRRFLRSISKGGLGAVSRWRALL